MLHNAIRNSLASSAQEDSSAVPAWWLGRRAKARKRVKPVIGRPSYFYIDIKFCDFESPSNKVSGIQSDVNVPTQT
jgi:hypothetical protein